MSADRLRAKRPTHDVDDWRMGTVETIRVVAGGCVVTVRALDTGDDIDLRVSRAIRELFERRLDGDPLGATVWFQKHGE